MLPSSDRSAARFTWFAAGLVALAAALAWGDSLGAPFAMDDHPSIVDNPTIRRLWPPAWMSPPAAGATVDGRPVLNFTFALNHALGGADPRGYRLVNVLIHVLSALTLFGLVRRTLRLSPEPAGRDRPVPPGSGDGFALAIALLWLLHPLQTAAVTAVVQRAESLMGLFYLLTLYTFVRATADRSTPGRRGWLAASVAACVLGMGTKEVMATAPLLVLLCDRAVVAGSFAAAWRARRGYYLALAGSWLVLGALVFAHAGRGGSAGFGTDISAWHYVLTQCQALLHYLRLAFWPAGLVFDYGTPMVTDPGAVAGHAVVLVVLLSAAGWALVRRPVAGLPAAAFFLLLAPSSSVVPVATQTIAEHRMYLPLAAVIVLVAAVARAQAGKFAAPRWLAGTVVVAVVAALGVATHARNQVYRSEIALWQDTAAKRPDNPRARHNLGLALDRAGRSDEAVAEFRAAIARQPTHAFAHFEIGRIALLAGRWGEAVDAFAAALGADPRFVDARVNLARALVRLGRLDEAAAHYRQALAEDAGAEDIRAELVGLLIQQGRAAGDEAKLREALAVDDGSAPAWFALGNLFARQRRFGDAITAFEAAVARDATHLEARGNLANSLLMTGRAAEAIRHYEAILQVRPNDARVRENLRLARESAAGR
jgi:tetratricopeptide (TPR) repeat protein